MNTNCDKILLTGFLWLLFAVSTNATTADSISKKPLIYSGFHYGRLTGSFASFEIKTSLYLRNRFALQGLSIGLQRIYNRTDTLSRMNYLIPVCFSGLYFFKQDIDDISPFARLDFGLILTETSFTRKNPSPVSGWQHSDPVNKGLPVINFGLGVKVSDKRKEGLVIEAGYKFLPLRSPQTFTVLEKNLYFNLGVLF
jgi:hypothetical protein